MVLAILQARMSSTRLPGKVLAPLAGAPMILRQIERLRRARELQRIVVATSIRADDDPLVEVLAAAGVPVMGHVGLKLYEMSGLKTQGWTEVQRQRILADVQAVADAGAYAIILEGVPAAFAAEITKVVHVPTISGGSGGTCDGQVLVMHHLLGLTPGETPPFIRRYAEIGSAVQRAFETCAADVRAGRFPSSDESFV